MKEMRKKRIVMAVTSDLATDQRVDRSCTALTEAGYEVTLVGRRLPGSPRLAPRGYATVRMRLLFRRSALFYAEYNVRLLLRLLLARADAYFANDSDTLLACTWAARLRGRRLVFDAHELFPEVPELVGRPAVRRVWERVERRCLPRVDAALTVSQSVAEEYERRYGVRMTVARNLPKGEAQQPKAREGQERTIIYQGAVNVGRGVRELIDAMGLLPGCRLWVAGDGDLRTELEAYAKGLAWCERVTFWGRVAPERLRGLTRKADLGVCLLEDLGLNYRYALPNRMGDLVQAGVPVVATDFVEMRRLVEAYGTGTLTEACPKEKKGEEYADYVRRLAATLREALDFWDAMPREERERRFALAAAELNWEREKKKLTDAVDTIF